MKIFSHVSNLFNRIIEPYYVNEIDASLAEVCEKLTEVVQQLEDRISVLEQENISTTNELYRLENSLDARIDILTEHYRNNKDV